MKYVLTYCFITIASFLLHGQDDLSETSLLNVIPKSGFIENKGQITDQEGNPNSDALFILPTPGNNVVLRGNGFSYDTYVDIYNSEINSNPAVILPTDQVPVPFERQYHRIDITFANSNASFAIKKYNSIAGVLNFYSSSTGDNGILDVRTYSKIVYENIYPNIDIEFLALDDASTPFEYNIILHSGADIQQVVMEYSGMNDVVIKNESLVFSLAQGELAERIPLSFRHIDQSRLNIGYELKSKVNEENEGLRTCKALIGFSGLNESVSNGITIDPTPLLLWATYYGGTGADFGYGIAKDLNGFLLVCGATASNSLIATAGAQQTTIGSSGVQDSFILKLDDLGVRQWCTYYGGSSLDYGRSLICDITGNVYIAGDSESSAGISTAGSHQSVFGGIRDSYLLKLNAAGVRQWCTYYGGSGQEFAGDICMDGTGNLIMVGNSGSTSAIATGGSFQNINGGSTDGYIVKFNQSGTRLWGTFVGGLLTDAINSAAIDLSNNIYVVGNTVSTNAISTSGAFQTTALGNNDAFIMKFASGGSRLWGTYYGGSGNDIASGVSCDISDYPCISGYTQSTAGLSTLGAHQTNFGGGNYDGFVVRFNTTGALQWATFFGGSLDDWLWNIYADDCGNMYTVGQTQSTSGIATADTHQGTHGGLSDFCITKFEENGIVIWSTYFGGSGQDYGRSLCLDQSLDIYVTGQAASAGLSSSGAQQASPGGAGDAMILKLYTYAALPIELISFGAFPNTSNSVVTVWETASETNNAFFTVERSLDGKTFTALGNIEGAGNSLSYRSYQFTDQKPLYGQSYYRLKQTDFNGQFTYSNLVAVSNNGSIQLQIAPNPSNGVLKITIPDKGVIEVFNTAGNKVFERDYSDGIHELDLTELPQGVYICKWTGSESVAARIVIHK